MKLLCLHGRRQSGSTLAKKMFDSASCKGGNNEDVIVRMGDLTFVFVNGPHVSQADLPKGAKPRQVACEMYSWWSDTTEDGSKALQVLDRAQQQHGPFDGVLGFSQGGALAASLCRESISNDVKKSWRPSIGIFLSAYYFDAFPLPLLIRMREGDTMGAGIKSLHVWGEKDQVVPPAKSKVLCEWMQGDCLPIAGGHAAPQIPWAENVLIPWLHTKNSRFRAAQ